MYPLFITPYLSTSFRCVFGCCKCQVYVRWPVRGERSDQPYLTFGSLEHDHPVDKGIVDEVRQQTKPLDTPTKDACGKLTGEY